MFILLVNRFKTRRQSLHWIFRQKGWFLVKL